MYARSFFSRTYRRIEGRDVARESKQAVSSTYTMKLSRRKNILRRRKRMGSPESIFIKKEIIHVSKASLERCSWKKNIELSKTGIKTLICSHKAED